MRLPVTLITTPTQKDTLTVEIKPNGVVIARWWGWGYTRSELTDAIRNKIDAYFQVRLPKHDYYWRGTNNRDEIKLIRSGQLRPSTNHADGTTEAGLSVADHLGYVMTAGYRYGYRVRGKQIGTGSDGESILALDSLVPLDKAPRTIANIRAREDKAYFAALRRVITDAGWTVEQYRASMWAYVDEKIEYAE